MKAKAFSVATLNLANLNEPGLPMYGAEGLSHKEYEKKIEWTAEQVAILNADVFGFQELWNERSLLSILKKSGKEDGYDAIVPDKAVGREIVCAAIAKKGLLVGTPEWIKDFPDKMTLSSSGEDRQTPAISVRIKGFSRPVLHFIVRPNEEQAPIHLYVCHFKSKRETEISNEKWYKADPLAYKNYASCLGSALSTIRRTAEAAALRMILTDAMKGSEVPVIVLGDMNDNTYSNTANVLTEQPTYLVGTALGGRDNALYSTQTLQEYRDSRDVYYTYVHEGFRESLDQIFVSQEFYDHSKKRTWFFNGMIVNNDHLNFSNHKEMGTSDHGAIKASFKLGQRRIGKGSRIVFPPSLLYTAQRSSVGHGAFCTAVDDRIDYPFLLGWVL